MAPTPIVSGEVSLEINAFSTDTGNSTQPIQHLLTQCRQVVLLVTPPTLQPDHQTDRRIDRHVRSPSQWLAKNPLRGRESASIAPK